jgi:hypothetical protein
MSNLKLSVSNLLSQKSNLSLQKRLSWLTNKIAILIAGVTIAVTITLAIIFG